MTTAALAKGLFRSWKHSLSRSYPLDCSDAGVVPASRLVVSDMQHCNAQLINAPVCRPSICWQGSTIEAHPFSWAWKGRYNGQAALTSHGAECECIHLNTQTVSSARQHCKPEISDLLKVLQYIVITACSMLCCWSWVLLQAGTRSMAYAYNGSASRLHLCQSYQHVVFLVHWRRSSVTLLPRHGVPEMAVPAMQIVLKEGDRRKTTRPQLPLLERPRKHWDPPSPSSELTAAL